MVVGAGELTALEPELEGVLIAVPVAAVDAAAGVLVAGVYEGVVAVHLGQMVTVSVVMKVETLVIISTDVFPSLVWVLVETGQLVMVV